MTRVEMNILQPDVNVVVLKNTTKNLLIGILITTEITAEIMKNVMNINDPY